MVARVTEIIRLAEGHRMRVTRLDSCGRLVYGDRVWSTSDGFVSVGASVQSSTTNAIDLQNARGRSIIKRAAKTSLTGYALEIVFAEVDPELFTLITGQRILFDYEGHSVGFATNVDVDTSTFGFALEVWAGAVGGDVCEDEDADGGWGYFLYPFNQGGIVGDKTIQNDAISFTITGVVTQDGARWGKGPYDVVLNPGEDPGDPPVAGPLLEDVLTKDHELLQLVTVEPPAAVAGARPLQDPTWATIASVTGVAPEDEFVAVIGVAADPVAPVGVLYDFGDGNWDYVEAPGDTTHDYTDAGAGTYTLRATTNGTTWVTTPVVIPGV